jgi:hypothetical protein
MPNLPAQLIADVTLYSTENGGRQGPTPADGFGCPCLPTKEVSQGWDCRLLLDGSPMQPGETRRVGVVFLSPEQAIPTIRAMFA